MEAKRSALSFPGQYDTGHKAIFRTGLEMVEVGTNPLSDSTPADAYGDAYANAYGAGAFVLAQEPCDDGTDAGNGGVGALEDCPAQIYDDLHSLHILPCSVRKIKTVHQTGHDASGSMTNRFEGWTASTKSWV